MKSTLMISGAVGLCALMAFSTAWANPVQINGSGSPAQSQVYGDGSAASSSHAVTGPSSATVKGVKGGNASVTNIIETPPSNAGRAVQNAGNAPSGSSGSRAQGSNQASTTAAPSNVISNSSGGWNGGHIPVASAEAPPVMSFNPCAGSAASGAAQFAPFGLSFGTGGGFDNACRLHMLGKDHAAVAYLCRVNSDVRQAFKDIGEPCPQDTPPPQPVVINTYTPDPILYPIKTRVIYIHKMSDLDKLR